MKIIYAGTPDFAVPALKMLSQTDHEICLVLTQPDRPKGRGQKVHFSEVKQCALDCGLPIMQPKTLKITLKQHNWTWLSAGSGRGFQEAGRRRCGKRCDKP